MAKLLTGPMISEVRGKCGDVVFSRNRGGMFSRRVPVRLAPWSQAQLDARSAGQDTSALWNTALSEDQRIAWRALASTMNATDQLRQRYTLTGQQLFCKINIALLLWAPALMYDPPPNLQTKPPPTITSLLADSVAQTLILDFDRAPSADDYFCIRATRPVNVGRQNPYTYLCYVCPINFGDPLPADVSAAYFNYHPALVAGKRIMVEVRTINLTSGLLGRPYATTAIIS